MMDPQYQQYYAGQVPQRTYAPQPYMGPVYAAGGSQAARPGPVMHGAAVGLDLNHDGLEPFPPLQHFSMQPPAYGRPDLIVQGPDYNQDGIPDALQQAPEDEEPMRITMVVPEGATPGTKLQYAAPDGQELRLTVPEGVPAGSMMTLTQDPMTKQWKCMAEPAEGLGPYEPAAPAPPQTYGSSVNTYTAPAATYAAPQERVTYVGGIAPVVTTYTAPPANYLPRTVVGQPQPVNLSYVPPPAVMQQPAMTSMGQVITAAPGSLAADPSRFNPPRQMPEYGEQLYLDQRPSYTPPPVILDQRPSYQPPPQVLAGAQPMPRIGDAALLGSTAKVQPQMAPPIVIGQTPSYVPPPVQVMQNSPSYVPPMQPGMMQTAMGYDRGYDSQAASIQMPAGMQAPGPSITTLPPQGQPMMGQQMPMRMPHMGQPGMPPMMTGMPGVGGQTFGLMPMGGLPPLGQMPPLGQLPPMGPPSMGMLGPGSAAPLGSGLVPPGAAPGTAGMPGSIQEQQMMQQLQMQQQQQQQQLQHQQQLQQQQQQQQLQGMGMQGHPGQMPGQMQPYQMPGMAPPYPGAMPGMEAMTMPGGMHPQQAMSMPGMMQPQQGPGGMPQAY